MAPLLKVLLEVLRIIRLARHYIKRLPRCCASFLALLGRKLNLWWRFWLGKSGSSGCSKPDKVPFVGTRASSYSVSGGLAVVGEYVIAASFMPASASHPSLHERTEGQPATAAQTVGARPPIGASPSIDNPHDPNLSHPFGGRSLVDRSYGDQSVVSIQSPASDKPLSPPPINETRGRQSATSVDVDVQNPSTLADPLPIPGTPAVDLHNEPLPGSPMSFSPTSDYILHEGRFVQPEVQPFNSLDIELSRSTKDIAIPRKMTDFSLKPLTITFPYFPEPNGSEQDSPRQECRPWIPATHPNGALYFYDEERRLFTDNDMHNSTMRDEIEKFYNRLQRVIHIEQLSIPSNNYDLVLDIKVIQDKQIVRWSYYYACHEARCLLWLETYAPGFELFGVKSPAHVKHRLEHFYWFHWYLFPAVFVGRRVPLDAYDELMGMLTHGCVDLATSGSSTVPFDDDTMHRMIRLVQGAKEAKGSLAHYSVGIARLLAEFAGWRFLCFHGQRNARISKDQAVYDKPIRGRSLLITILSPLLFLAPEVHLREMNRWSAYEFLQDQVWKSFDTKLLAEWEGVILWSTVMLSANVGFLAIPGVVLSNLNDNLTSTSQVVIFTSHSQIAGSLSMVASIGSTVIGLLLIRLNRTKLKEDQTNTSMYLLRNSYRVFGLEPMAIYFSLPWALLMWSMVMFSIALLLFSFTFSNVSTRIFVAIMSALVATLIGWCVWISWDLAEFVWQSLFVLRRAHRVFLVLRRIGVVFKRVKEFICTRRVPQDGHVTLTGLPASDEVRV